MTTEWRDLPTIQDVARAKADGCEIEFANSSSQTFTKWSGVAWHADRKFRARPHQPKMQPEQEIAALRGQVKMLRDLIFCTATSCRLWGGEAERARIQLEEILAATEQP